MRVKVSQTHLMDRAEIVFDDVGLVANAGVGVVSQLAEHLGLGALADARIGVGANPGAKVLSAVCAMALGGDCIDDVDILRAGSTAEVLSFRPAAASTVGTWLRDFSWGHVRQLESVAGQGLERAWQAGAAPAGERWFMDGDSSILEVFGDKQGAAMSYNNIWSLHPLFVSRGGTGEILAARLRRGNATSADGADDLVAEAVHRARRGGAKGEIVFRADSAFYDEKLIKRLRKLKVRYSISAPDNTLIRDYISYIPESAWVSIPYRGGVAQVAETLWRHPRLGRIIVRRVKNIDRQQAQCALFAEWKMIAFVTDRAGNPVALDREHRQRAAQETSAIRELKENALAHLPSKRFATNAAWLQLACLAHNLQIQLQLLGGIAEADAADKPRALRRPLRTQATVRRRLLTICGRITRSGRRVVLHLPARWPWERALLSCIRRLRLVAHPT